MTGRPPITRRSFVAGAGAAVAWSPVASGQARMRKLAMISPSRSLVEMTATGGVSGFVAFFAELQKAGFVEGQNLAVERFTAAGDSSRYDAVVGQAIASAPDAIAVVASPALTVAVAKAAPTIPVISMVLGDPSSLIPDVVQNLGRPGRNVTAVPLAIGLDIEAKRLQLLHEAIPDAMRIGYLTQRAQWEGGAIVTGFAGVVKDAAPKLGISIVPGLVDDPNDEAAFRAAFAAMGGQGIQALHVAQTADNGAHGPLISSLALAARLPTMTANVASYPDSVLNYGANTPETYRRSAVYVARVLNGEKPAEMPVLQPEVFDFVVNLKTAKALGMVVPFGVLAQATEVIE